MAKEVVHVGHWSQDEAVHEGQWTHVARGVCRRANVRLFLASSSGQQQQHYFATKSVKMNKINEQLCTMRCFSLAGAAQRNAGRRL